MPEHRVPVQGFQRTSLPVDRAGFLSWLGGALEGTRARTRSDESVSLEGACWSRAS